ncbi:hypothetical protein JCM5350_008301 [Sporobolomyces pararoseus]
MRRSHSFPSSAKEFCLDSSSTLSATCSSSSLTLEGPKPCKAPCPALWAPSEVEIDATSVPQLPPLPPAHASQVFLHKSSVGHDARMNMDYEAFSYKPLEFYGDAMVSLQISRVLMKRFPNHGPGIYSFLRANLIDKRSLGIIGWGCGLAPLIKVAPRCPFGGDEGRNCTQGIVCEVFEAYIGALAQDPCSNEALSAWFDQVFGEGSPVLPNLEKQYLDRLAGMKEVVRRRTCPREKRDLGGEPVLGHIALSTSSHCDCLANPKKPIFKFVEQNYGGNVDKKGSTWHTVITYQGKPVACAAAEKRLDAREAAWSSGLAKAMGLDVSSQSVGTNEARDGETSTGRLRRQENEQVKVDGEEFKVEARVEEIVEAMTDLTK